MPPEDDKTPENDKDQDLELEKDDDLDLDQFLEGLDSEPDPDDDDTDQSKDKDKAKDKEPDKDADKDKKPPADDLEKKLRKAEEQITNLNKALHAERQAKKADKPKGGDEEPLSEQQLRALFKEHQDDPDTLYNLVQYMAQQSAKGVKKEAINEAEISRKQKEIKQAIDEYYPDVYSDSSDLHRQVEEVKDHFHIKDHPFADFLALGILVHRDLEDHRKEAYEKGKEEALKGKTADDKRKQDIKGKDLAPDSKSKKSKATTITPEIEETAKQIGLTPSQMKIYARLRAKPTNRVEV